MATEPNLRDLFRAPEAPGRQIDVQSVIRRSKRRRLPAQVGIGGAFTLAVGGIGFVVVNEFGPTGVQTTSQVATTAEQGPAYDSPADGRESTNGMMQGDDSSAGIKRAPADRINLCGGPLAEVAPSPSGLVLTVDFPDAPAGAAPVAGTVTLTNTGTEPVAGYSPATPAVTLSQNGIVLWHSNGPTIMMLKDVALAPGESLDYAASFTPVVCGVEDDSAEAFRDDLPPAAPGEYQVSAATDVSVDGSAELVTGPTQSVRIG
jgi:hypothetical protein